jgi:hypothetical protein
MNGVAKHIQAKEPGTLKYQLLKEVKGDAPKVVVSET